MNVNKDLEIYLSSVIFKYSDKFIYHIFTQDTLNRGSNSFRFRFDAGLSFHGAESKGCASGVGVLQYIINRFQRPFTISSTITFQEVQQKVMITLYTVHYKQLTYQFIYKQFKQFSCKLINCGITLKM